MGRLHARPSLLFPYRSMKGDFRDVRRKTWTSHFCLHPVESQSNAWRDGPMEGQEFHKLLIPGSNPGRASTQAHTDGRFNNGGKTHEEAWFHSCCRTDSSIEREHICRGIEIGDWMIAHAKQLICDNSSTVEALTEQYKAAIRRKKWKVFTAREMQRVAFRSNGKYPRIDHVLMILDALVEDGSIAELAADEGQKRWQVLNLD